MVMVSSFLFSLTTGSRSECTESKVSAPSSKISHRRAAGFQSARDIFTYSFLCLVSHGVEKKFTQGLLGATLQEKDHMEERGANARIILKWIFKNTNGACT
jgi:hypothetical protein